MVRGIRKANRVSAEHSSSGIMQVTVKKLGEIVSSHTYKDRY